ncbi:hypothetical protein CP985_08065 [Malaciobacter mytili LMG 24559]|uniref:Uncharacterized protein n=1 Tax=Malaciobacter mytili LMG 24559 TaxID=1032238 RepID=A0AAX2AGH6_9BACT|nr:hypothetical protein [Malaciobacter mytili]AXH13870.1 hypothetical protein AMYT_0251 [Malaciobacter mytili LMG 24559]RXK15477.1 hypothetical protein CP985_08065 [Malaciobacter mytili LMG 24559]
MTLDLLIPFLILIILVIYLIYTRSSFEKNILTSYEEKFQEWKKHNPTTEKLEEHKELVGLIFKKGYKVEVELFNEEITSHLQKGKFSIKGR